MYVQWERIGWVTSRLYDAANPIHQCRAQKGFSGGLQAPSIVRCSNANRRARGSRSDNLSLSVTGWKAPRTLTTVVFLKVFDIASDLPDDVWGQTLPACPL
jgi:hypothetical protein